MLIATSSLDLSDFTVLLLQPFDERVVHLGIHVARLDIVDMPQDSHLAVMYLFVSDTWIIWVDFEPLSLDACAEFLVKYNCRDQKSVNSTKNVSVEDLFSSFNHHILCITRIQCA